MQKHPKQAFGIFEDGHSIRLAHLIKENDLLYLEALDRVDLDKPIYRESEERALPETEPDEWDEKTADTDLKIEDYDASLSSPLEMQPYDNLFAAHPLRLGVIALNINDDNIIRSTESFTKPGTIKKYAKDTITAQNFKAGSWEYSFANIGGRKNLWLHQGINLLLEMVRDFQKKSRIPLYYQLADANDIALTDYFKQLIAGIEKRMLLVCLGEDYRKAFVFENGVWIDTLPLQIPQRRPEVEVIYSKLSLALDSSPHGDPEVIVVCGDMVNDLGIQYLRTQFEGAEVNFLGFPHLIVDEEKADLFDQAYLSQFAIPIALAYKALHPDDAHFTQSNFLPSNIVEGQKVFKVAWHGFLVLGLIFVFTTFFTVHLLQGSKNYREATKNNRELNRILTIRREEAKEIQQIRMNLELHQKSIEAMRTVLDNKNPWSFLLDLIDRKFASLSTSWLTNLRMDKGKLILTGTTTNRGHVIQFADMLPNSQIRKVTNSKVRNYTLWQFEISSDLPKVDWMGKIEEDLQRLMAIKEAYGEGGLDSGGGKAAAITGLAAIPENLLLTPPPQLLAKKDAAVTAYNAFLVSAKGKNIWQYRELGQGFMQKYLNHPLAPYVRWRMAYRFYLDKEYGFAMQYLKPMLKVQNSNYGYAVLLAGRIYYATGDQQYKEMYRIMKSDYAMHPLAAVVNEDLKVVGK
ncbi:MAG TPA: hypothetical protein PL124_10250 [Candidatus Cloacimonadota bacterium]|nr:hypothetical protein [Candidatus Cloacimonadota bacterium]HPS39782.1 hypothetical protein [Candidatus Cloacimonadota bacterium]